MRTKEIKHEEEHYSLSNSTESACFENDQCLGCGNYNKDFNSCPLLDAARLGFGSPFWRYKKDSWEGYCQMRVDKKGNCRLKIE